MTWLIDNWGFVVEVAGVIAGGFKIYYGIAGHIRSLSKDMSYELKEIRADISRLEKKQDAYNTLQERTLRNEIDIKYLRERRDDRGNETDRSLHI